MTQNRSLISTRRCTEAASASVSNSNVRATSVRPTGTSRSTPSVPRASQWPSATTRPPRSFTPMAVATALMVTPAQATSASSSMSAEHARLPSPPVAGCRPAVVSPSRTPRGRRHDPDRAPPRRGPAYARFPLAHDTALSAAPAARAVHSRPSCRDPVASLIIADGVRSATRGSKEHLMPRQTRLNAFDMNCVSHISRRGCGHPRDHADRYNTLDYWIDLARVLEHGKFDALFLADVFGVYD